MTIKVYEEIVRKRSKSLSEIQHNRRHGHNRKVQEHGTTLVEK
jgi:hypothetical protein